jgi:hypothetical protein
MEQDKSESQGARCAEERSAGRFIGSTAMKRAAWVLYGMVTLGLFSAGATLAQTPAGTAFTYQGQLKENGVPVNTTTGSVRVALYDAETGGNQIGASVLVENVTISNGLFTIPLDFGSGAFDGEARWLAISVYKTGTGWVLLTPRQKVTPAPQAQFAQNAAALELPFAGTLGWTAEDAFKLDYAGDGWVIRATSTGVDAGAIWAETTDFDTVAVYGKVAGLVSTGVAGWSAATGPGSAGAGGAFGSAGEQGTGVGGTVISTTGVNYGVRGESNSPQGYGGYFNGRGYFSSNVGIGVLQPTQKLDVAGTVKSTGLQLTTSPTAGYVLTSDATGIGSWQPAGAGSCLWHLNGSNIYYNTGNVAIGATDPSYYPLRVVNNSSSTAISGECPGEGTYGYLGDEYAGVRGSGYIGVKGETSAASGTAVAGGAWATGAVSNIGGQFSAAGNTGTGVYGIATATTGDSFGVRAESNSTTGAAVYAEAKATSGTVNGVYANTASTQGSGVFGQNTSPTGDNEGVNGVSWSPDGKGVIGWNGSNTGNAYGVLGRTASATGIGVFGEATQASGTNYGVYGKTSSANGYAGYFNGRSYFSGNVGLGVANPAQKLDVAGIIQSTGFKLTSSPTAGYVLTCDAAGSGTWQPAAGETLWQQNGSDIYYGDGKVGIGVMSPSATLDVLGGNWDPNDPNTAGDLRIGNDLYGLKFCVATSGGGAGDCRVRSFGSTSKLMLSDASGDTLTVDGSNVGVGTTVPTTKLDVIGTVKMNGFKLTAGPTDGYVLTCDASGNGTWQAPTGGGGFALPYEGTLNSGSAGITVTNTGAGAGLHGVGGNKGVEGDGTYNGVTGFSSTGNGVSGNSGSGVGVKATSSGTSVDHPALYVQNINSGGINIFSTCSSTDANAVFANTGTGDIIKGFSGTGGGDLVFRVENNGKTSVSVLQITGGADLSEQFDVQSAGCHGRVGREAVPEPGMVVCIDPENPGKLIVSTKAYDRTVAGIISGAGGVQPGMTMGQRDTVADGGQPVALTGRVYVWADASRGAVQPGDLLTTSDRAGHAMKVADYDRAHGAILGKAMTALSEGQGLVLVLVSLQ